MSGCSFSLENIQAFCPANLKAEKYTDEKKR